MHTLPFALGFATAKKRDPGEPPSALDMLQLMRRGKVTRDEVVKAVKQSRIKNEWIDTILELGIEVPTPTDILRATLQGQIGHEDGRALYQKLGGDPEYFQLMFNTEGSAPTTNEAAQMANRGIIPYQICQASPQCLALGKW